MATHTNPPQTIYLNPGDIVNYTFTGNRMALNIPAGQIRIQCWGAQGDNGNQATRLGGRGGYAEGIYHSPRSQTIFIYVGGHGGWNGGGVGGRAAVRLNGGGSSDVRVNGVSVDNRIIVAGAGGAAGMAGGTALQHGGAGGGLNGINGNNSSWSGGGTGGTQAAGGVGGRGYSVNEGFGLDGAFGEGGMGGMNNTQGAGGGAGWFGGGGGGSDINGDINGQSIGSGAGGGGSSFIHPMFTNSSTIAGNASMPNPRGSGNVTGVTGHGHVRLTVNTVIHPSVLAERNNQVGWRNANYLANHSILLRNGNDLEWAFQPTNAPVGTSLFRDGYAVGWRAFGARLPEVFVDPAANVGLTMLPNDVLEFTATGAMRDINLRPGRYLFECWGAQGGNSGGLGGYAHGERVIATNTLCRVSVGVRGVTGDTTTLIGGWNGGGNVTAGNSNSRNGTGGGASDIRIGGTGLAQRVLTAAGGGGRSDPAVQMSPPQMGHGGGTTGANNVLTGTNVNATGATQTAGGGPTAGTLGQGAHGPRAGAGGGHWGGGTSPMGAAGGSSFVGGVTNGITTTGTNRRTDGSVRITLIDF